MAALLRGEIRWANLDPTRGHEQGGTRPVLILSRDEFNQRSRTVIAVALTSREPRVGFPFHLESCAPDLAKQSWIKVSQIRILAAERVGELISRAPESEMARVLEALYEIIGP